MGYLGTPPQSGFITTAKQRVTSSTNNYVDLDHSISIEQLAVLAELPDKTIRNLNPGFRRSVTPPHQDYKILIPIEHVDHFNKNLAKYQQHKTPHHHQVKKHSQCQL